MYCMLHENAKILQNNSAGICFSVDFKSKKHQKAAPIQLASSYYDAELVPSLCLEALLVRVLCMCVCVQYTRV